MSDCVCARTPDRSLFVVVSLPSGRVLIGVVFENDLAVWKNGGRLPIQYPQALQPMPVQGGQMRVGLVPPHFTDTPQSEFFTTPEDVEVVGDVIDNACNAAGTLFNSYTEAVTHHRANLAGVTLATSAELHALNKGNIVKFPPKK